MEDMILTPEVQISVQIELVQERDSWIDVMTSKDWTILKKLSLSKILLNLCLCEVTPDNIIILKDLKLNIEALSLGDNQIQREGLEIVLDIFASYLKQLSIFKTKLIGADISLFLTSNLTNIKFLSLSNNNIGHKGIKFLVKADLSQLQVLHLNFCFLGSEAVSHLAKGKWNLLQKLQLQQKFSHTDFNKFIINQWPKLRTLTTSQKNDIVILNLIPFNSKTMRIHHEIRYTNYKLYSNIYEIQFEKYLFEIYLFDFLCFLIFYQKSNQNMSYSFNLSQQSQQGSYLILFFILFKESLNYLFYRESI